MIQFIRKKHLGDERLLQIILLFSLLRGSPHLLFPHDYPLQDFNERDLVLGNSLGHTQFTSSLLTQEVHPKSFDRVLESYQRSVIQDLHTLGDYENNLDSFLGSQGRYGSGRHQRHHPHLIGLSHRGVQTLVLNAETSFGAGPPPPVEGSYVTGPPSPETTEEDSLWGPLASSYFHSESARGIGGDLYEVGISEGNLCTSESFKLYSYI